MRNLKPYNESTTDFFDSLIAAKKKSKNDPGYLARIALYRTGIITAYGTYDAHIAANSLVSAAAVGYESPEKDDLIRLYHYKAKIFQELKIKLTTDEYNRLINTCQNCTINAVNSFDHVLPKDEFSEFAVNPKNLFPSCTECNGYKSKNWRRAGNALFLNLLLDVLPQEQYLFAEPAIVNGDIKVRYKVDNPHGIDPDLFKLIDSHYDKLHLSKRFTENSGDIISELVHSILSVKDVLGEADIRNMVITKAELDMKKYGRNYWKAITSAALIGSDEFYSYALRQG